MSDPLDRSEPTIGAEAFASRLVALCVKAGPSGLPRKMRDQQVLLKSIALTFDPKRTYGEFQVNETIKEWLAVVAPALQLDHVTLRRMLIDDRYLVRDGFGQAYQIAEPRQAALFEPSVGSLDVWKIVDEARREIARRRAMRTSR